MAGGEIDALITEKDLISFDGSVGALEKELQKLGTTSQDVDAVMTILSKTAKRLFDNLSGTGTVALNTADSIKAAAINAQQLNSVWKQLAASQTDTAKLLAELREQLKQATTSAKLHAAVVESAKGSINNINASISELTNQYNALSKAERENASVGGALKAQIQSLVAQRDKLNSDLKGATVETTELSRAWDKLVKSESADAIELAQVKEELRQVNAEQKLAAQEAAAADGSYNKLSAQINALVNQYKALSEAERTQSGDAILNNIKALAEAREQLNAKIQASLETRTKLAELEAREAAASSTEAQRQAELTASIKSQTAELQLKAQVLQAAQGSYNEMAAALKLLTSEYYALSAADREGPTGQGKLQQIHALSASIAKITESLRTQAQATDALTQAQEKLNHLRSSAGVQEAELAEEIRLQKHINKLTAIVQSTQYADNSYKKLAAQYELAKIKLDAMDQGLDNANADFLQQRDLVRDLYKQMQAAQEAMGRYQLGVGQYHRAFDNLQFSMSQIVREMPSLAVSWNTFFLAISNNIPPLMDEIKRTRDENAQLRSMGEKTTSVFSRLVKSVISWQTAIVVVLAVLSKYGKDIIEWIRYIFSKIDLIPIKLRESRDAMAELNAVAKESAISNEISELRILQGIIRDVKSGTDEWGLAIKRVTEITGKQIDTLKDVNAQIDDAIEGYIAMQVAAGENKEILDELTSSELGKLRLQQLNDFVEGIESALPRESIKKRLVEAGGKEEDVEKWLKQIEGALKEEEKLRKRLDELVAIYGEQGKTETTIVGTGMSAHAVTTNAVEQTRRDLDDFSKRQKQAYNELTKIIQDKYQILTNEAEQALEHNYTVLLDEMKKFGRKPRTKTYAEKFSFDPWYEARVSAEAESERGLTQLETLDVKHRRAYAIAMEQYYENLWKREKYWVEQRQKLEEDFSHGLISRDDFSFYSKQIDRSLNLDKIALAEKYTKALADADKTLEDAQAKLLVSASKTERQEIKSSAARSASIKKIKEYEKQLKTLQQELEQQKAPVDTQRIANITNLAEITNALAKDLEQVTKEYNALASLPSRTEEQTAKMAALKAEMDNIQLAISAANLAGQSAIKQSEDALATLDGEITAIKSDIDALVLKRVKLDIDTAYTQAQIKQVQEEIDKTRASLEQFQGEVVNGVVTFDNLSEEELAQFSKLSTRLDELTEKMRILENAETSYFRLARRGRAQSVIGIAEANRVTAENIEGLIVQLKYLREQQSVLDSSTEAWRLYGDAISGMLQKINQESSKLDIQGLTKTASSLYELIIDTTFDTIESADALDLLTSFGKKFADAVNTTVKASLYEAGLSQDVIDAFYDAVDAADGDIGKALESLSPTIRKAIEEALQTSGEKAAGALATVFKNAVSATKSAFSAIMSNLKELAQAYVDLAQAKVEAAEKATSAAEKEYDKEQALLEAGYANNVETAWAELQEKKRIQKEAEAALAEATKKQQDLDNISQVSSLVTAIANLYSSLSLLGPVGIAAATALSATMIGTFIAAKAKAKEAVAAKAEYGEGHVELIGGGSHASGNDSPLAYDAKGRERRVEGGEMFAVFNKRAVRRLGASTISDLVQDINKGHLASQAKTFVIQGENLEALSREIAIPTATDLSRVEKSLFTLVDNSSAPRVYFDQSGNRIIETHCSRTIYKK